MTVLKEVWPDDINIYEDTASLIREGSWKPTATKPQDTPWLYPYEKMTKEDTPFVTCLFMHTEGSQQPNCSSPVSMPMYVTNAVVMTKISRLM